MNKSTIFLDSRLIKSFIPFWQSVYGLSLIRSEWKRHFLLRSFAVLLIGMVFACRTEEGRVLDFNDFQLATYPEQIPSEFPRAFHYDDAKVIISAMHSGTGYWAYPEGVAVLESDKPAEEVIDFYRSAIAERQWTIIQSHNRENETLLMAESPYRNIFTVIVEDANPVSIKVYYKRGGGI